MNFSRKLKLNTLLQLEYETTTLIHSHFDSTNLHQIECTLVWTYKKISVTIILREFNPGK